MWVGVGLELAVWTGRIEGHGLWAGSGWLAFQFLVFVVLGLGRVGRVLTAGFVVFLLFDELERRCSASLDLIDFVCQDSRVGLDHRFPQARPGQ